MKKLLICSNPKCKKEIKQTLWSWQYDGNNLNFCSNGCYFYGRYLFEEANDQKSARYYLLNLHTNWLKEIEPYLENWEKLVVKARNIENEIRNAILEVIEQKRKEILETLDKHD